MINILPDPTYLWLDFKNRNNLSDEQLVQFQTYYDLLVKTNEIHNLTAIEDVSAIIHDHFDDSLSFNRLGFHAHKALADVGTGAGFPGLALKIVNPALPVILIEVNRKKIAFLRIVIEALSLKDIEIHDTDWRTFLRKTSYDIDVFCARASLEVDEFLRIFKAGSRYKEAQFVYWASRNWQPTEAQKIYIKKDLSYTVGDKLRRLIVFQKGPE